jgi:hypothetical protein
MENLIYPAFIFVSAVCIYLYFDNKNEIAKNEALIYEIREKRFLNSVGEAMYGGGINIMRKL